MTEIKKYFFLIMFFSIFIFTTNSFSSSCTGHGGKHSEEHKKTHKMHTKQVKRQSLNKDLTTSLNNILKESNKLHLHFFMREKGKINAQIEKIISAAKNSQKKASKQKDLSGILDKLINSLDNLKAEKTDFPKVAFSKVNQQLTRIVKLYNVDSKYHIFYCSMEKKPWVAEGKKVNNPYAPESMPHCGELKF